MRIKYIYKGEFNNIAQLEWEPVELKLGAIPSCFRNIPAHKVSLIAASGTMTVTQPYRSENIVSGTLVGGIDVWRNGEADLVKFNKDWYAVVIVDGTSQLSVDGPFKDSEHWSDEIPKK